MVKKCKPGIVFLAGCILYTPLTVALNSVSLTVEKINVGNWLLRHAEIAVFDIDKDPQQFVLLSAAMALPPPLNHVSLVSIHCKQFLWDENFLQCLHGQGQLKSDDLKNPKFDFSFKVQGDQGTMEISRMNVFGNLISMHVSEKRGQWVVKINAKDFRFSGLKHIQLFKIPENIQGVTDFRLELRGTHTAVRKLKLAAFLKQLSMQTDNGKFAVENLSLKMRFSGDNTRQGWYWRHTVRMSAGALYIDPVYLEFSKDSSVSLQANGFWQAGGKEIRVDTFQLDHQNIMTVQGEAKIDYDSGFNINQARLGGSFPQLKSAVPVYLNPFLEASPFEGLTLAGKMDVSVNVERNTVSRLSVFVDDFGLNDKHDRIQLKRGRGRIQWALQSDQILPSFISWRQLKVKAIPFEPGRLDFVVAGSQFKLQKKTDLAVLGGVLKIDQFSFKSVKNDDADLRFKGRVKNMSLEQLSKALDWTPLSGKISGYIPSVRYQNKKLELNGEIRIQVFDGVILIKKLASSGMFSDFARFYTDIEFDNLDLKEITRKFQFGSIEGRVSGFAKNVYLENWYPVTFYAWLGTPDGDKSRHRISQKAVENIASIGGDGAADLISRGFLRFFDTFGYDKLGFGCYLHQGVCQVMGVEAADNGYYLVKGGGLPRIDVIGYNPRLDWNVLMRRLSRIVTSDEVVIE